MIELYVDGASAGNPGKSGIGIYIKGEGTQVKLSEPIEPTNNHTAEFIALLRGMEETAKLTTGIVSARSDSKAVVSAVENEFVKNELHKGYLNEILSIAKTFEFFFIKWIPDTENRAADALAREAIHQQSDA
ncbi:ribonuclease HI family protein [Sporosarcina thermotolerans]|uniref:Ribonuclease HI family protein n=1 Tax=Sporosarcina thermotolerans TaxID=633404 RepID=A0AAW9A715_9BACL|nr:ribonuclease HI family protein [Sporosarcina thermotolerans]MDW0115513.1 ribonuclease HI family protein [Sporosarcina thermotolerans]WHT47167.1 ribonuclease HI family protein [Sporosarcina thermotolerans]